MRDKYGVSGDSGCYPGTAVLMNKLDLRDPDVLAEAEAEFAASAVEHIEIDAPPFDFDYLCRLHGELFNELYNWAGQPRSVDVSKGQTRFCTASRIIPEANRLLDRLAERDNFFDLDRPCLVRQVAELYGDLNVVHPFREGNGRAMRLFFEHLILVCGYGVRWEPISKQEWLEACIAAVGCDYAPLAAVFDRCIGPLLAEAS